MSSRLWGLLLVCTTVVMVAMNVLQWQIMQAGTQRQSESTLAQQQAFTEAMGTLERQPVAARAPELRTDVTVTLQDEQGKPATGQVKLRDLTGSTLLQPAEFQQTGEKVTFAKVPYGVYEVSVRTADGWAGCTRKVLVRPESTSFEFVCPTTPEQVNTLRVELTPPEELSKSSHFYVVAIKPEVWLTVEGHRWALNENPVALVYGNQGDFLGQLSEQSARDFLSRDATLMMEFPIVPGGVAEARSRSGFVSVAAFASSEYRSPDGSPLAKFKLSGVPAAVSAIYVPLSIGLLKNSAGALVIGPEHEFWKEFQKPGRGGLIRPVSPTPPRGNTPRRGGNRNVETTPAADPN